MPNKVPLEVAEDEIRQRCEEIQATWTDGVRELRRRGNQPGGAELYLAGDRYTVPTVSTGCLPAEETG
jgi:hypothetical protein